MSQPPILTGLLGGSFNPAHGGHRRITLFAADALGLDETWWLVSPGNPLKPQAGMAPLAARLLSARKQARRAAKLLKAAGLLPDIVLTSRIPPSATA